MSEDRSREDDDRSLLEKIGDFFSSEPRSQHDLMGIMQEALEREVIDKDAFKIVQGAMDVDDLQVREIMIPRPQMTVIQAEAPPEESLPTIIQSGHSRYPVVGESGDDVIGILLTKDLLPQLLDKGIEGVSFSELLREPVFVPESKRLNVLLREFRENRNHMAIVIDEYGGVAGLVTIEDVLEQIVGDIEDEYDNGEDEFIRKVADNDYIIRALTPVVDFNGVFGTSFEDGEFDTVGGLVLQSFGYLPGRNEVTQVNGFEFRVINADSRQIHLLRMRLIAEEGES